MSHTTSTPGIPIVFLHAYPLHSAMWDEQVNAFEGRRVMTPDLPGFGGRAPGAPSLDDFAEQVIADMDEANIDRAVVVGLSMGGYTAFRLHARWPERIAAMVLADTRAEADSEEAAGRRVAQAERARSEGTGWLAETMIPSLLGETSRRSRPEVVERVRRMIASADAEGVARALDAMRARPDSTAQLGGLAVPVLVLVGEEDTITPEPAARTIVDGVPGGTLEIIPQAGHLSNLENPGAFNEAVRGFVREVESLLPRR